MKASRSKAITTARTNKQKRHDKIRAAYAALHKITTPKGRQKFTHQAILEELSEQFGLSETTIGRIVAQ